MTNLKTGLFSDTHDFKTANRVADLMRADGIIVGKVFPIIDTCKCTVDPETLPVWQVESKWDIMSGGDIAENISAAQYRIAACEAEA